MQETYISLNPANTSAEERAIRSRLYTQRLLEAQGGRAAPMMGTQWGLTAAILTYSYMQGKGFSVFPFAASKTVSYGKIGAAFLFFYGFGHNFVLRKFGDKQQLNYLMVNRQGIVNGSKPWDRPQE